MFGLNEIIAPKSKGEKSGESDRGDGRAEMGFRNLSRTFIAIVCALTLFPESSHAQSSAHTPPRLITKSIGSRFDTNASQSRFDITSGLSIDDVVSTPLQTNSEVNDTFIRTERQQGSLTLIYNTYNPNYADSVENQRTMDSLNFSDSVSKQIAAYEGTLLISRTLASSPMANIFAEFSENLRAVRDALMFRVGPAKNGEIEFEPAKNYGKNPNFIELRLTPTTKDGISPRLRLGEHVSLSHDFSGAATFLEYNINF